MRLKIAALVGLGAILVGFVGCGDTQRSTYVRYTPAANATGASPAAT